MPYFQKVVKDDGTDEYVEVADRDVLSAVEIPEEIIREHPTYKQVLDESVQRRQRIADLREELERLSGDEPLVTEGTNDVVDPPQQPQGTIDKQALIDEVKAALALEAAEAQRQAAEKKAQLEGILKEHKLPNHLLAVLEHSTDPETVAQTLAKSQFRFDDTEGGAPSNTDRLSEVFAKVGKDLNIF